LLPRLIPAQENKEGSVFFTTPRIAAVALAGLFSLATAASLHAQDTSGTLRASPKKTVAVAGFEAPELAQGGATAEELTALLVDALLQDGRYVVLERAALADVQAEQQLSHGAASGATHVAGASALIRGTVTKFEPAASGGSLGLGNIPFLGGGGANASARTAEVTISLRVIDATTSQILFVGSASGRATTKSINVDASAGLYNWNGGAFLKTPLGEALQDAIRKSVDQIAIGMQKVPWSASVIDCDGKSVYITAGLDQGVWQGAVFHVYRKGRVLTDPSSGVTLDVMYDPIGTIQVQTVRDKISIATITSGSPPARGDVVRIN
jgi:curli biogenesis system outer membrane secretion channel CsgG